jgi:hypothetical protein
MCARITRTGLWRVSYGDDSGLSHEELIQRQPEKFRQFLPGKPGPEDYTVVGVNPYRMHQRLAPAMWVGRVGLVADAGHCRFCFCFNKSQICFSYHFFGSRSMFAFGHFLWIA